MKSIFKKVLIVAAILVVLALLLFSFRCNKIDLMTKKFESDRIGLNRIVSVYSSGEKIDTYEGRIYIIRESDPGYSPGVFSLLDNDGKKRDYYGYIGISIKEK